jgi:hypothetical protein
MPEKDLYKHSPEKIDWRKVLSWRLPILERPTREYIVRYEGHVYYEKSVNAGGYGAALARADNLPSGDYDPPQNWEVYEIEDIETGNVKYFG